MPPDPLPAPAPPADAPPPVWPGRTDAGEIEVLAETVVWENPVVRVCDDAVRFPPHGAGGPVEGRHFRLAMAPGLPDGVVVAAVDEADGRLLLVRQFRHPVRRWMTECPRGGREAGETPEQAAARELREETGAEATAFLPLGRVAADSGQLAAVLWLVAARVRRAGPRHPEAREAIDRVVPMTYGALRAACERGELFDGLTMAVVLRLAPYARGDALALPWPDA
jgi:ADP-ribose pyrophosphatase